MSPDGRRAAAQQMLVDRSSESPPTYGPIRVHDLETGSITTMQGLCVWVMDEENPQCRKAPETPFEEWVWSLDFSPDGALLAAGGFRVRSSASGTRPQVSCCSTVASLRSRGADECLQPGRNTPGRGERDRDRRVRRGHLERGGASAPRGSLARQGRLHPRRPEPRWKQRCGGERRRRRHGDLGAIGSPLRSSRQPQGRGRQPGRPPDRVVRQHRARTDLGPVHRRGAAGHPAPGAGAERRVRRRAPPPRHRRPPGPTRTS